MKREIRVQDSGQSDIRKIEALCDHLGAKQDIDLVSTEVAQSVSECILFTGGVCVETGKSSRRKYLSEYFFDLLGPIALQVDRSIVAFRARARNNGLIATEVTDQPFFRPVVGQWNSTMLSLADMATAWTLQGSCKSTAIQKKNHLLSGRQFLLHVSPETLG